MKQEIVIINASTLSAVTKKRLREVLPEEPDIVLALRPAAEEIRTIDPTVLVAIVGMGGTAVGTLLGGLLKIVEKTKEQTITITGKTGRKVEITGKPDEELLRQCIKLAKELDVDRIEIG